MVVLLLLIAFVVIFIEGRGLSVVMSLETPSTLWKVVSLYDISVVSIEFFVATIGNVLVNFVFGVDVVVVVEVIILFVVAIGVVVAIGLLVDLTITTGEVSFTPIVEKVSGNLELVVLSVLLIRKGGSRSGNIDESILLSKISCVCCSTWQQDPK